MTEVDQIDGMSRADLMSLWEEVFAKDPPKSASMVFLRNMLAYEVQSRSSGGLPALFFKELNKLAERKPDTVERRAPLPGGKLLREWNGRTHKVEIGETGYLWEGKEYRSLSAIAKAITGAHWSGPRFFGIHAR